MFTQVIAVSDESDPLAGLEPSPAELAAIEAEWPLIVAEFEVTNAQIRILTAAQPSPLDWRALRRAERRAFGVARRTVDARVRSAVAA